MLVIKVIIIALLIYALYKVAWYGLLKLCRRIDTH